jgi:phospholipid-translocating ATPase
MKYLFLIQLPVCFLLILVPLGFCHHWQVKIFRALLLLSFIIPISLRITMDFSKAYFCYTMEKDPDIEGCTSRNSNIPEDLG